MKREYPKRGKCPCGGYYEDWHSHASECIVINPKGRDFNMKWISVEDKLPDYNESVLVYPHYYVGWRHKTDASGEHWTGEASDFDAFSQVTHWMPLPEPPPKEKG